MTNHWTDIQNADVIMVNGSNAAENHPVSFRSFYTNFSQSGYLCPYPVGNRHRLSGWNDQLHHPE
jgi:hypothetical protein